MNIKKTLSVLTGALVIVSLGCCHKDIYMRQSAPNLVPFGTVANVANPQYSAIIRLTDPVYGFNCTAFVIDGSHAMTAAHCLCDEDRNLSKTEFIIKDDQGRNTTITAKAIALDHYQDVGFLAGDFRNFKHLDVDFSGKVVKAGMVLKACGFPSGQADLFCADLTQIGNAGFEYRTVGVPLQKGQSGGPVFEVNSKLVIGVNSAVDDSTVIIGPAVGSLETAGLKEIK
jgi:hypothetical protein